MGVGYSEFSETQKINIAKNLRYIRKNRGLRIEDICNMINVSTGAVSQYETKGKISYANLKKMCKLYQVPMKMVCGFHEPFVRYLLWETAYNRVYKK